MRHGASRLHHDTLPIGLGPVDYNTPAHEQRDITARGVLPIRNPFGYRHCVPLLLSWGDYGPKQATKEGHLRAWCLMGSQARPERDRPVALSTSPTA